VSVARFIASQRTEHGVPHAVSCRALDVSEYCSTSGTTGSPPSVSSAARS
jgi:hypothetical protein